MRGMLRGFGPVEKTTLRYESCGEKRRKVYLIGDMNGNIDFFDKFKDPDVDCVIGGR